MLAEEFDILDILFRKRCDVPLVTLYRTAPDFRRSTAKRVRTRSEITSRGSYVARFPPVSRQLQGLFLKSIDMFRDLARRAVTAGGLRVFARTLRGLYQTGRKAAVESIDELHILFRTLLLKWNYYVFPKPIWEAISS